MIRQAFWRFLSYLKMVDQMRPAVIMIYDFHISVKPSWGRVDMYIMSLQPENYIEKCEKWKIVVATFLEAKRKLWRKLKNSLSHCLMREVEIRVLDSSVSYLFSIWVDQFMRLCKRDARVDTDLALSFSSVHGLVGYTNLSHLQWDSN